MNKPIKQENMNPTYQKCAERMKEISALAQTAGLLGWDQETMMPEGGIEARAEQESVLSGVIHEKIIDPGLGDMLRKLASTPADLTEDERVCAREWLRDHEKSVKIPPDLVRELSRMASLSQHAWIKARKESDFSAFAPYLEKTLALKCRQAEAAGYKDVPYDALLDYFEPGMTVAELDPIVEGLERKLVPIVQAICDSMVKIDARVLVRRYPEAKQEELAREILAVLGLDMKAARLDRSAHPFCSGIALGDVRITTRYNEKYLAQSLYSVIHECGHALYDQGLNPKHSHTPLSEPVSLGIHESQSRLWENIVGRSREFVKFLYPRLKKKFPSQMKGLGPEKFYGAINSVEPSLIRTESDEVTYNLHIVLRYELEKAMLSDKIKVKDLPGIWNEKMEKYLGARPKNDAEGVLQDTHWASGLIGYFPTYLLGNIYSAQIWAKIRSDIRGAEKKIAKGNFAPILAWLCKNIHRHGRRYPPQELIKRATGQPPCADYFINYLKGKYGEMYGIRW